MQSNWITWPCLSFILCHFWTWKRLPVIFSVQNLNGWITQVKVSGKQEHKESLPLLPLEYQSKIKNRGIKQKKINNQKPTSKWQLSRAAWINVQYVHADLSPRRAWPSFSCRCVSTGEACQTPGSPFQRCQRTFRVLSDARIENKGGEKQNNARGLTPRLQKRSLQKWQTMSTAHSLQKFV